MILDMEEDIKIPSILGRPFLKTSGALVDHIEDDLTLMVEDEKEGSTCSWPPIRVLHCPTHV